MGILTGKESEWPSLMTECQNREENTSTPTSNSNCTLNLNILFLKEDERFHKSEGEKKPQNSRWEQNVSRDFTSSSLAVLLSFQPRPLCKQASREHAFRNGLDNKQLKTSAKI